MLNDEFREFGKAESLPLSGRILLGISGGVDSVVLLDLLHDISEEVVCLHVNYGLRSAESDKDEQFVRDLCERSGNELVVVRAEREMKKGRGSVQEIARAIRYREFEKAARTRGIGIVSVAHHADDQVETVLMNLFRGAGLNGLAGIPVSRDLSDSVRLTRPLLFARREDILHYAQARGLTWREDASNADPRYRRTAVRNDILPLVEKYFGDATADNILRASNLARDALAHRRRLASLGAVIPDSPELYLADLLDLTESLQTRVILDALQRFLPHAPRTRAAAEQVRDLLVMQTGRRVDFGPSSVVRERDALRFVPIREMGDQRQAFESALEIGETIITPSGLLAAYQLAHIPSQLDVRSRRVEFVDAARLRLPLTVTTWKDGDHIALFGGGRKKVSDLLTDRKVAHADRRDVLVVRSAEDIVWVVGISLSATFAINSASESAVVLAFIPHDAA